MYSLGRFLGGQRREVEMSLIPVVVTPNLYLVMQIEFRRHEHHFNMSFTELRAPPQLSFVEYSESSLGAIANGVPSVRIFIHCGNIRVRLRDSARRQPSYLITGLYLSGNSLSLFADDRSRLNPHSRK